MNAGSVSKSTIASSKMRRKSPPRSDADRAEPIKPSKGVAASGLSAARSLHSHGGAGGAARKIAGRSEVEAGHSDSGGGGRSTIGCSGARHAGPGAHRRISTDNMHRGDRVKAEQIRFDQVRLDSA